MSKTLLALVIATASLAVSPAAAPAQDRVILKDGRAVEGFILGSGTRGVRLRTATEERRLIPEAQVEELVYGAFHIRPTAPSGASSWEQADAAEHAGQVHESRGRNELALERFHCAIEALLSDAKLNEQVERRSARVEFLMRRLSYFLSDAAHWRRGVALFSYLQAAEGLSPYVRGLAGHYLRRQLSQLGEAPALAPGGGFIDAWYLIGPFDNDQGTGWDRADPPERELKLSGTYPGKLRPVRWRPCPVAEPRRGIIDLAAMMRPNQQVQAYALAFIKAEARTPAALRLASAGAVKAWLNGAPVLDHDRRRPLRLDQSQAGVVLSPGWNTLLLKLGAQSGDWAFRARITAPDGAAAKGLTIAALDQIPDLAAGAKPAPLAACAIDEGALPWLEAWIKDHPEDHRSRFRLAYLHFTREPLDIGERRARVLFAAARKLAPDIAYYHSFYALTAAGSGPYSVNKEENAAREAYEKALELDPSNAEAACRLASYYARSLGNEAESRAYLARALAVNPRYRDAQDIALILDKARGFEPLVAARLRAIAAHHDGPWALAHEAQRAMDEGQLNRALELRRAVSAARRDDNGARGELVALLLRLRRHDEAADQVREGLRRAPFDRGLMEQAASIDATRKRIKAPPARGGGGPEHPDLRRGCLAWSRRAVELCPEDIEALMRLGHRLRRFGERGEALRVFERALAVEPRHPGVKKYLRYLKRETEAGFEEGYILDSAAVIAAAQKRPVEKDLGYRVLLRNRVIRVRRDGRAATFNQEVFRLENEAGARGYGYYSVPYYPGQQHVSFRRVRVTRADGRVVDVPARESSSFRSGEFQEASSHGVSLPPLQVGDIVEVQSRVDTLEQSFFGGYYGATEFFQDAAPIERLRVTFLLPKDGEFYFRENGVAEARRSETASGRVIQYEARSVAKFDPEPYMPWAREGIPSVAVSTFKDWDAFARWYWALVKDQHESDKDMAAFVRELTREAKTDEDKIRAIYEWVVTEVRYNDAWEFGIHGFKPYNATSIFARKFGDCKDKSTLINTMLRELGIESYPVLIFGAQWPGDCRGREELNLPMVSHFNHCISYVMPRAGQAGRFLDGTAQHHPFGTLPTMDYGARVVVVTPRGAIIKDIPMNAAGDNAVFEQSEVTIAADGSARVKTKIGAAGDYEVFLRDALQNKGQRKEVLERILGRRLRGAKVVKVRCSKLEDLREKVEVEVEVQLPTALMKAGGSEALVELRSWLFERLSPELKDLAQEDKREHDLILANPRGLDETVRYKLPPGTELRSAPKSLRIETPFGVYRREVERRGDELRIRRRLELSSPRIPKEKYAAFRGFVGAVERAESERVLLKRSAAIPR